MNEAPNILKFRTKYFEILSNVLLSFLHARPYQENKGRSFCIRKGSNFGENRLHGMSRTKLIGSPHWEHWQSSLVVAKLLYKAFRTKIRQMDRKGYVTRKAE